MTYHVSQQEVYECTALRCRIAITFGCPGWDVGERGASTGEHLNPKSENTIHYTERRV